MLNPAPLKLLQFATRSCCIRSMAKQSCHILEMYSRPDWEVLPDLATRSGMSKRRMLKPTMVVNLYSLQVFRIVLSTSETMAFSSSPSHSL